MAKPRKTTAEELAEREKRSLEFRELLESAGDAMQGSRPPVGAVATSAS